MDTADPKAGRRRASALRLLKVESEGLRQKDGHLAARQLASGQYSGGISWHPTVMPEADSASMNWKNG